MKSILPPHIGWPLFVIALLMMSVITSVGTFFLARSDGGAQVVEHYYQKAVDWDHHADEEAADTDLGWHVSVTLLPQSPGISTRDVQFFIVDRNNNPLANLEGRVRAFRPQWVKAVMEAPLRQVSNTPGAYLLSITLMREGLWDFEIDARHGSQHFIRSIRHDLVP